MAELPAQLLSDPARLVCTWTAPVTDGSAGQLTIQAFADPSKLALPMLLNPDQQRYALEQFANILAGEKLDRARGAFALVLGMLETVADKIIGEDGEIAVGPDGEPFVPQSWVDAFQTLTRNRPAAPQATVG